MSEDAQERTEQATPKREQELKNKGQVIRSKELSSLLNLMGAGAGLYVVGTFMIEDLSVFYKTLYSFESEAYLSKQTLIEVCFLTINLLIEILLPFLVIVFGAILLGPSLVGGWSFSGDQITPKLERLDPIKGIKKMVSLKGFVELIKSILKILLVAGISSFLMWLNFDNFLALIGLPLFEAMASSLGWILFIFVATSSAMIFITMLDVPFQIFDFTKQSKMTKQQVKDESKETDGRPEVKSKIRSMQRQLANARMMDAVGDADVVITNPTHYAVALKYDESMRAPKLVAKGLDLTALRIREKAAAHKVPIVEMPPLARALYFGAELEDEVPHGLYKAVAKVLAYIYQLREYKRGKVKKPILPNDYEIPEEYQR